MFASTEFNRKSDPVQMIASWFLLHGVREPRAHITADFIISKDNLVLIQEIVVAYGSSCFFDSFSDRRLRKRWHSLTIPPLVPKTNGVNAECSTSITLCRYSRFFEFSLSR